MLFPLIIILVQFLAIQANSANPGNDIKSLCAGKNIDLTTFSQLKELATAADGASSPCSSSNISKALHELVTLIETGRSNLCSLESIDALKAYYTNHLDTSAHDEHKERLPKPLTRFALAYGMQASNLCKKNMVKVLSEQQQEEGDKLGLKREDFEQISPLVEEDGPVARMLGSITSPGEVLVPGDLAPILEKRGYKTEKLFIQTATGGHIKRLQSVCQHKFKPVYEPLMMPIARLSNLGFNYKDKPLKCELKCPAVVQVVGRWSRIVFVCESLNNLHIVEGLEDREMTQGTGSRFVRIVSKEEAAALEEAAAAKKDNKNLLLDGQQAETAPDDERGTQQALVYQAAAPVTLGDLIHDKSDKRLEKAIKSFRTSRSELENIKRRLASKGFAIVKQELRQGHVGLLVSTSYKGVMQRMKRGEQVAAQPQEQLVRMLDKLAERQSTGLEGPISGVDLRKPSWIWVAIVLGVLGLVGGLLFFILG